MIRQSGRASPGRGQERALARDAALGIGDRAVLLAPGQRPAASHGRRPWCRCRAMQSETTTNGQRAAPRAPGRRRGRLTAGLVAMIQIALIRPSATASNMSTAFRPGPSAMRGAPQKRRTRSRWLGLEVHVRGQRVGHAAGLAPAHGVGLAGDREGPTPGLPMRPVARWALMIARPLAAPWADWLAPWRKS